MKPTLSVSQIELFESTNRQATHISKERKTKFVTYLESEKEYKVSGYV